MIDCIICSTTSNHPPLQSSEGRLLHPSPPSVESSTTLLMYMEPRKAPTPKNKNFSSHPPVSPAPPIAALTLHSMLCFLQGVGAQRAAPLLLHCWTQHHYYHYWGGAPLLFSPPPQRYSDGGWSISSFSNDGSGTLRYQHSHLRTHWPAMAMGLLTLLMSMMRVPILCIPSHARRRLYIMVAARSPSPIIVDVSLL